MAQANVSEFLAQGIYVSRLGIEPSTSGVRISKPVSKPLDQHALLTAVDDFVRFENVSASLLIAIYGPLSTACTNRPTETLKKTLHVVSTIKRTRVQKIPITYYVVKLNERLKFVIIS